MTTHSIGKNGHELQICRDTKGLDAPEKMKSFTTSPCFLKGKSGRKHVFFRAPLASHQVEINATSQTYHDFQDWKTTYLPKMDRLPNTYLPKMMAGKVQRGRNVGILNIFQSFNCLLTYFLTFFGV